MLWSLGLGEHRSEKPRILGEKGGQGMRCGAWKRQSPGHPCAILSSLCRCRGHTQECSHAAQQVWRLPLPPTLCSMYTLLTLLPGRLPRCSPLILFFLFQEIKFYFIMIDSNQGYKSPRIMTNTFPEKILLLLDSDLC